MGRSGRRKMVPRLDGLLPEEARRVERLVEDSQITPWKDDSERTDALIRLSEEAVRKEPHEFVYHYLLGANYFSGGELEKAKDTWEKASSLKPGDPRPLYDLGVIYYGIWNARTEEQRARTAEEEYTRIKEILSKESASLPEHLRQSGEEIVREFENKVRHLDYEGQEQLQDCYRTSPVSRDSAAANALYYFRKVLACQLHPEDRKAVEEHIRLIEALP